MSLQTLIMGTEIYIIVVAYCSFVMSINIFNLKDFDTAYSLMVYLGCFVFKE